MAEEPINTEYRRGGVLVSELVLATGWGNADKKSTLCRHLQQIPHDEHIAHRVLNLPVLFRSEHVNKFDTCAEGLHSWCSIVTAPLTPSTCLATACSEAPGYPICAAQPQLPRRTPSLRTTFGRDICAQRRLCRAVVGQLNSGSSPYSLSLSRTWSLSQGSSAHRVDRHVSIVMQLPRPNTKNSLNLGVHFRCVRLTI